MSASAALSADALGLPGPTSSQKEGLASCAAITSASFFFSASCSAVSRGPAGSIDETPQHQRIGTPEAQTMMFGQNSATKLGSGDTADVDERLPFHRGYL